MKRKDEDSDRMSASTPPESVGDHSTSSQGKCVGGIVENRVRIKVSPHKINQL